VPTRLLDWTLNPLAALYFAVEDDRHECDAVVWCTHGHRHRLQDKEAKDFRFDNPQQPLLFVMPDHTFTRAGVQGSLVACWGDPSRSFLEVADKASLWKINIPADARTHIKWILFCLGVTQETLFPGLDGLGTYLAWKHGKPHEAEYEKSGRPQF